MRRQYQRDPALPEAEEPVPDGVASLRVEPGRRLVQQQQVRIVDERARDREPALHSARERLHAVICSLVQLDEFEQLIRALAQLAARQAEVPAVDDDVLADGELLVERLLLRGDTEVGTDLRAVRDRVEPEDAQKPARWRRDAADHPHRRGLPRSVRTQEPECFAALDVEVDAVHGDEAAEALDEAAGMDQRQRLGCTFHALQPSGSTPS